MTYGLLLNLVSLPGVADKDTAWKFVQRYAPGTSPDSDPELDALIGLAVNYARDFVAPEPQAPRRRTRWKPRRFAISTPSSPSCPPTPRPRTSRTQVFEVGKRHPFESLRGWFQALYETLLGSSQGPRMGSFIALYGIDNSRRLIAEALSG